MAAHTLRGARRRAVSRTHAWRLVALAMAASAGCSLGIDKTLLDKQPAGDDASTPAEAGVDAPAKDATQEKPPLTDSGQPQVVASGCATDADCKGEADAGGSCVSAAKCDATWHVCLLTTCAVGACKAAVCNTALQTCSVPTTYGFEATQFSVQQGGVGTSVQQAVAAAWPFLFVITTNGVVGFNVVDPTNTQPPAVGVHGIPFIPGATLAVGRRVYFFEDTVGSGPTYRQAIAWIDVPQDPLVTDFVAGSAFVGTTDKGTVAITTNGIDGAFISYSSGSLYPTADFHPPLSDTTVLSTFSNAGLPSGASIGASSGSRLVTYRYDGAANLPNFALVNGAGTASAQTTTEQAVSGNGEVANQTYLRTGDDGSLLWMSAVLDLDDAGASQGIGSARLTWLLPTGTSANFDTTLGADLETYSPPTGAQVVAQPGWIDANTALGLAAASTSSTDSTSVQVVTKNPPSVSAASRTLISVAPANVGVATSNGFGYVLAQDDAKNLSCSVYIFAPSCVSGDP
jgi:hypothetical protein